MRNLYLIGVFLCGALTYLSAQKLPATNVYLFNIEKKSDSLFVFSEPQYLTNYNADGYNNQPSFMSDDVIFLSSQMWYDTTQTDIYELNLLRRTRSKVTETVESEYSPTLIPFGGEDVPPRFSAVRVEADGENTQRLWQFPINRSNNGKPVFNTITGVGYHGWMSPREVALFVVGDPHQLITADVRSEGTTSIANDIGRCLKKMPGGHLAFVHILNDKTWLLKKLNRRTYRPELVTAMLPECEDFAVLPDGTFIIGKGSKLYKFNKKVDVTWKEIADLGYLNIHDITRMDINPSANKIVIVSRQ